MPRLTDANRGDADGRGRLDLDCCSFQLTIVTQESGFQIESLPRSLWPPVAGLQALAHKFELTVSLYKLELVGLRLYLEFAKDFANFEVRVCTGFF